MGGLRGFRAGLPVLGCIACWSSEPRVRPTPIATTSARPLESKNHVSDDSLATGDDSSNADESPPAGSQTEEFLAPPSQPGGAAPGPCVRDKLEPNDNEPTATRLGVASKIVELKGLTICPGFESDRFSIEVKAPRLLTIDVDYVPPRNAVVVAVVRPWMMIMPVRWGRKHGTVVLDKGRYIIVVFTPGNAEIEYSLRIEPKAPAP